MSLKKLINLIHRTEVIGTFISKHYHENRMTLDLCEWEAQCMSHANFGGDVSQYCAVSLIL